MPDNPLASLYPQPPQQQSGLLSNPLQAIGAINALNQNARFQQEFAAKKAVGSAFQNALNPDGTLDDAKLSSGLQNPEAAYAAPEAIGSMLSQRQQQIQNARAQFDLNAGQNSAIVNTFGPLAANPNTSKADVLNVIPRLVRMGVPADMAYGWYQSLPRDKQGVHAALGNISNIAMGPAASAGRVVAPPTAGGVPQSQPLGTANIAGTTPIGLAPGAQEAAATAGSAAATQGVELGRAADSSPVRKGMLGNLETDLNDFTSGPGADWTKVAKAWANRNVLPTGLQFDPKSIASQEAFTKQAEQLAQQQFQAIGGTGTDAKFGSAFKSNPNDTLSGLGNKGIIRLLKGNEDALQAKNKAWQDWLAAGNNPQTYQQFSAKFNQSFDPRVYQSQYMSREDFTKMLKSMSGREQSTFLGNLKSAQDNNYASRPGSSYAGQ